MLKRRNLTIPFYMDPWFWVKLMVFVIFALFLVSLTLFTSAHFLRAFSPTRYFLLSHSNQDRVMVMSEFFGCYCLENPMERGAWWATVQRVTVRAAF